MEKRQKKKTDLKKYRMLFIFLGMIVLSALVNDRFLTVKNIANIMRQIAANGILACGMTFVMLTGGFDLSVGATLTLAGGTALTLQPYMGVGGAIAAALLVGALCGCFNGVILSGIKAGSGEAFMITLGSQLVIFGISLLVFKAKFIPGSKSAVYNAIGTGNLGWIPVPLLIFAATAAIAHVVLAYTSLGRRIYLTGGNYEAARLSGVRVGFYKMLVYVVVGVAAAMSAVVLTSRSGGCSSDIGKGYELDAIAAVMVGGTSTDGGEGNIGRTILGVLMIGVLNNILNLMGMSSFNQMIAKGIVVILAVWLDGSRKTDKGGAES
ncbi:MAG TPA: ribose ABC transporter permease [Lachnospiraceae bacterium]|nr:ribose ABC transporter permease [Lachnospiraceae bacterium]